jgi:hypothetical protein
MRKGRKRPSTPSPESFWKLGHDAFSDFRSYLQEAAEDRVYDDAYLLFLQEQAADKLLAKLEAVQVGQWRLAVREMFAGLFSGAEYSICWFPKIEPEDEHTDSVSAEGTDLRA